MGHCFGGAIGETFDEVTSGSGAEDAFEGSSSGEGAGSLFGFGEVDSCVFVNMVVGFVHSLLLLFLFQRL